MTRKIKAILIGSSTFGELQMQGKSTASRNYKSKSCAVCPVPFPINTPLTIMENAINHVRQRRKPRYQKEAHEYCMLFKAGQDLVLMEAKQRCQPSPSQGRQCPQSQDTNLQKNSPGLVIKIQYEQIK